MSKLLKSKFLILGVLIVAGLVVGLTTYAADGAVTMTLKQGMSNVQVKYLQQTLNEKGFTVATSGAGSMGSETSYFGPATLNAVKSFQAASGLKADGIVGPVTRAALSVASGTPAMSNLPAGCTSTVGYSPTTGLKCDSTVSSSLPAGCTSTVGYSPTTGAKCDGSTTAPASTVNANGEGSITVTYDAVPASNLAVNKGETKAVMAFKIKATGSDMRVSRFWADLNARIWLSASEASLWDGSTLLESVPLSSSTVVETTLGSAWQLQFNNLNLVVPVGTEKIVTFKVTRPTLTNASASITMAATSSFRAVDSAGLSNTYTVSARTINLSGTTTATTGTLTASLNANSPVTQSVSGLSTTSGVLTAVKLMDFDLKATDGPINVSSIAGTASTTGSNITYDVASLELRDGANTLASVAGATTFTFSSLNIDVTTGATKTLSVWAKVNPVATTAAAGYAGKADGIAAVVTTVTATTNDYASSASLSSLTVTSNTMYLFQYAPTITLGATSAATYDESTSTTVNNGGDYTLTFTVAAPTGSDIYFNTPSLAIGATYAIAKYGTAGGTLTANTTVSGTAQYGSTLTTWDRIPAGTSKTFTTTARIPSGTAAGYVGIKLAAAGINWTDTDSASNTVVQTWGLTDFHTDKVYVTAN